MPKDGVTLGQDPPVQFNDGDAARRVHRRDAGLLVLRVLFKGIACVIISDAGIFKHEADGLSAASRLKVEVMYVRYATNGLVAGAFGAAAFGGRHFEWVGTFVGRRIVGAVRVEIAYSLDQKRRTTIMYK